MLTSWDEHSLFPSRQCHARAIESKRQVNPALAQLTRRREVVGVDRGYIFRQK